nr:hypothetical protein [Mycoplasmopsis bovis]
MWLIHLEHKPELPVGNPAGDIPALPPIGIKENTAPGVLIKLGI